MISEIKLGIPNLWLQDPDPYRAIEIITSSLPERNYYTINSSNGFSKYVDGQWKPVLVENYHKESDEDDDYITTFHSSVAYQHLSDNKSEELNITYFRIVVGPEVRDLYHGSHRFQEATSKYRTAFWSDTMEDLPFQTIVISPDPCPQELSFCFTKLEDMYPTSQELATVLNHINDHSNFRIINQDQISNIANSGLGMTETQFIQACLTSITENATVTADYINSKKLSDIKSNGILEIIKPQITFDNIGGLDNIKDVIKRTAKLRQNPELANQYGISPIRRLLMVGIPGTGKSAICQATSAELGLDLARTGISQALNKYIGQSEENMRAVFRQIKAMDPLCVWIDEFGRDLSGSGSSNDSGTTDRVHGEFLTGLQELPANTFLMCAANDIHGLKPEMLRADRFDKIFFVGLPSHVERSHIFKINLSNIKDSDYDYDALAEATAFMTGAEIVSLIKETKFYVISETLRPITTQDILNRVPTIKNTIWRKHPDTVKSMYQYAIEQWDWASTDQYEDAKIILGKGKTAPKLTFS